MLRYRRGASWHKGEALDEGVERQLKLLGSEVASVCLSRIDKPT
jgi:hypothetical protein